MRGKSKPSRASWIILAANSILLPLTYLALGQEHAIWLAGAYALGCCTIALLTLWYGSREWSALDGISILGLILAIGLWQFARSPFWAFVITLLIDGAGISLTIAHAYKEPRQESRLGWGLMLAGGVLSIYPVHFALTQQSFIDASYPLQITVTNLIIFALVLWPPKAAS